MEAGEKRVVYPLHRRETSEIRENERGCCGPIKMDGGVAMRSLSGSEDEKSRVHCKPGMGPHDGPTTVGALECAHRGRASTKGHPIAYMIT